MKPPGAEAGMITPLDASIGAKKKKKTMIVVPRDDKIQMERMAL